MGGLRENGEGRRAGEGGWGGLNIGIYPSHTNMEVNMDSLEMQHQRPSEVIIIYADRILR